MVQVFKKVPDITGRIIELEQLRLFRELWAGRSARAAPTARRPRETQIQHLTRQISELKESRERLLRALDKIAPRKNPHWAILESPFVQGIIRGAMPGLLELGREAARAIVSSTRAPLESGDVADTPLLPSRHPIVNDSDDLS